MLMNFLLKVAVATLACVVDLLGGDCNEEKCAGPEQCDHRHMSAAKLTCSPHQSYYICSKLRQHATHQTVANCWPGIF
eukprot:scaffold475853_cov12-Prasinocladus_malaysianus.AAC.1